MNEAPSVFSIVIWCVSNQFKERQLSNLSHKLNIESTEEIIIKSSLIKQDFAKSLSNESGQGQSNPPRLMVERKLRTSEGPLKQTVKEILNHHYHFLSVDIINDVDALHLPHNTFFRLQKCDLLIIIIGNEVANENKGQVSNTLPVGEAEDDDAYLSRLVKKTTYYRRYQEDCKKTAFAFKQQNPIPKDFVINISVTEQLNLAQKILTNLKVPKPKVLFCFYGIHLDNQVMRFLNNYLGLKKRMKRSREENGVYVLDYPGIAPNVSEGWNKTKVFQVRNFAGLLLNELERIEKRRLSNSHRLNCLFYLFFGKDRLTNYVPYNKT